jgi:hypothetical protein
VNLHTQGLIDPVIWLLAQVHYFSRIIRLGVIGSKDVPGDKRHHPRYVAIGLLDRRRWAEGFGAVHKLVSDKDSPRLVGQTFRSKDMTVHQNRLLLLRLPAFLIPVYFRRLVLGDGERWWVLEVYDFYATNDKGQTGKYGRFIELAPSPRHLEPRHKLGHESIWQGADRPKEFFAYLTSDEIPTLVRDEDILVLIRARVRGWLTSLITFWAMSFMALMAWRHAKKHGRHRRRKCERCDAG